MKEVSSVLEGMEVTLDHCVSLLQRLNSVLPESDRLEPFSLHTPASAHTGRHYLEEEEEGEEEEDGVDEERGSLHLTPNTTLDTTTSTDYDNLRDF